MYDTNESVNQLLNYSKMLLDQMNQGKNYCGRFKEMQYLIFAGMISYYGFDHIKEIYETFEKTRFVYSNMSMINILKNLNLYNSEMEGMLKVGRVPALCDTHVFNDKFGNRMRADSIVISTDYDSPPVNLLDSIAHECNHIVNSVNKSIFSDSDKSFVRTGLYVSGLSHSYVSGQGLEECVNVLQTADIINEILRFTEFDIDDPFIANAISNIKYAGGMKHREVGYEHVVPFIKPLYDNRVFCRIVKDARMSGDIEKIDWEFDRKVGENAFSELKQCTDEIITMPTLYTPAYVKTKKLVYSYLNN